MPWFNDRDRNQTDGDPTGDRFTRRDGWAPDRRAVSRINNDRSEQQYRGRDDDDRFGDRGRDVQWGRERNDDWEDDSFQTRDRGRTMPGQYRDEGRVVEERTYRAGSSGRSDRSDRSDRFDDDNPNRVRRLRSGGDRYYRGQGYERPYDEREQPVDDGGYWGDEREQERNFRMPSGRDSERVREMRTYGLDYGDRAPQRQQTGEYRSYLSGDRFSNQDLGDQYRRFDNTARRENNWDQDRTNNREGFTSMGGQSWRADDRDRGPHSGRGPRGWQRSDERIHDEVCEALWRNGNVDASHVDVTVENGEVNLDGFVRTRHEKRLAEDEAERIEGVRDVHNRLRIGTEERMRGDRDQPSTRNQTYSPAEGASSVTTVARGNAMEHAQGMSASGRSDIREGMDVVSSDGESLGSVKQARGNDFLLERSMSFDVFVPFDLVASTESNHVMLSVSKDDFGNMNLQRPALDDWGTGAESSKTTGTAQR